MRKERLRTFILACLLSLSLGHRSITKESICTPITRKRSSTSAIARRTFGPQVIFFRRQVLPQSLDNIEKSDAA